MNINMFGSISSLGSQGLLTEPLQPNDQKSGPHSSPSGIPPPSVSGFNQSSPIACSMVSGIPSPSVSRGFKSSSELFWGLVPSRYSCPSVTPPSSVSASFHKVKYVSTVPFPPKPKIKSQPVVFSK